jgi:hypothetical protein
MTDMEPRRDEEFENFLQSWKIFSGDLSLVGAEDRLKPQDPFSPPDDAMDIDGEHTYHLTIMEGGKPEIIAKLKQIKVLALTCMDWRFANSYYDHIQEESARSQDEILFVGVGGGAVQLPEERQEALLNILGFISRNAPELEKVYLSGHTHRCGAVAHWLHAEKGELPKELGPQKGGVVEIEKMGDMLKAGTEKLKAVFRPEVLVESDLLSLDRIDERGRKTTITLNRLP